MRGHARSRKKWRNVTERSRRAVCRQMLGCTFRRRERTRKPLHLDVSGIADSYASCARERVRAKNGETRPNSLSRSSSPNFGLHVSSARTNVKITSTRRFWCRRFIRVVRGPARSRKKWRNVTERSVAQFVAKFWVRRFARANRTKSRFISTFLVSQIHPRRARPCTLVQKMAKRDRTVASRSLSPNVGLHVSSARTNAKTTLTRRF